MRLVIIAAVLLAITGPVCAAYWGISGGFADLDPAVSARVAPMLAQRGVNAVLLNVRGRERGWYNWVKVQKAWEDAGIAAFWDAPATRADCDWIQGFGEDAAPMSGEGTARPAGIFSPDFVSDVQRTLTTMAFRLRSTAGFSVAASLDPASVPGDPNAPKGWREFLAAFFGDESPGRDTNADTACFNAAYATDYRTWNDVPLFTAKELASDERKARLQSLWLTKVRADYVGDMCGCVSPLTRFRLNGASVLPFQDISLACLKKHVNRVYATYDHGIPAIDSAGAVFGKRVFASFPRAGFEIPPEGKPAPGQAMLKLLPYIDGAFFDYASLTSTDAKTGEVRFEPAFDVIPLLAPFAGRLQVNRAKVLWILPPEAASSVLDAYCISESAFALDPKCIDLSQYQAVIYVNISPCISTVILQKLFEYAVGGGTVILDAYHIGQGKTLHGRDNAQFWWEDLKLERDKSGEGKTTITLGRSIPVAIVGGTHPYLSATPGKMAEAGEVTDSTGAKYPLLLVRKMGKSGKWVFINVPGGRSWYPMLVRGAVKDQTGIDLADPGGLRVYPGTNCVLAIVGSVGRPVSIPCAFSDAVAFDPSARSVIVGRTKEGLLAAGSIGAGEAKIWVVKPYGQPVLLYADGVSDWAGSIDDGEYANGVLKFKFARRAYVSSPDRPKSVLVDGKQAAFDYDPMQRLVTLTRSGPGGAVVAEMRY